MKRAPSLPNVRPKPYLDHVMVLLDAAAHRDVLASRFLGERFGRVKGKKADSSVAGAYTTFGLAGENTLVELFGATMPGPVSLTGGLVFSFEVPGSSEPARELLAEAGLVGHHQLVERTDDSSGERRPWYHLLSADLGAGSPLLLFLNEVTTEYFTGLGATPGPAGELRRRDYLDAALGAAAGPEHVLKDITGVTLRLRGDRAGRIATALAALGFDRDERADSIVVTGSGLALTLVPDESAPEGVTEIGMALTAAPERSQVHQFGDSSELVLGTDGTATWRFTPVGAAGEGQ